MDCVSVSAIPSNGLTDERSARSGIQNVDLAFTRAAVSACRAWPAGSGPGQHRHPFVRDDSAEKCWALIALGTNAAVASPGSLPPHGWSCLFPTWTPKLR